MTKSSLSPLLPILITLLSAGVTGAREEHPLDGSWKIAFDPENTGRAKSWHTKEKFPTTLQRDVTVPSCWELIEKDYEGVAFYRRSFSTPADWKDKVVHLQFDAVNFRAEVWLNDIAVGVHEGGFTPFEFRVDDLLNFGGENTLILRVAGPILLQDKTVDGVGPLETPQWRGAITGGIWQSVRLIATGDAFVDDVFIEPKISEDTATFHVALTNGGKESAPAQIEILIRSSAQPEQIVARTSSKLDLHPGTHRQSWTLEIPDAAYWSPDSPHLYRVDLNVRLRGEISDRWATRFGMREFTIRDKKFHLNGKPLYLKATFFEGLYPTRLAYPDSREMAIREIELAKEAGFNMIRPWRKPPPPMWLDLADEMGVLTVGSLVVECMDFPVESPQLPGWVENEVRESILRDRNRTCVVQWELFNELKRPVLMRLLHPMSILARQLDPTRLILDESGGWAQGANMYLPYESEATKFNDIHDYPGPHINEEVYQKLVLTGIKTHEEMKAMGLRGRMPGRNVNPGLMSFFSELGYGSLPDLEDNNRRFAATGNPLAPPTVYHKRLADGHLRALQESGFDTIYPDLRSFCIAQQQVHGTANRRMIEAVRCNPAVGGYCIHALTAGNWIMGAGLLDLWRNPKGAAYHETKAGNQARILSIRVQPRNVYAASGTQVSVTGVNDLATVQGKLRIDIIATSGKIVFTKTVPAALDAGITPLFREALDTSALDGSHTVKSIFTADDGTMIAESALDFDVFAAKQLTPPDQAVAVLDTNNSLKQFLRKHGIEFEKFEAGTAPNTPVLVSRTRAGSPAERSLFDELKKFIRDGGTVIYLGGSGSGNIWGKPNPSSPLLPIKTSSVPSIGTWTGISHVVIAHPIFDGLPVDDMMGAVYENIWAEKTMIGAEGETVAGSIGFDWFPNYELHKRHYYGPGDTWWGSDLVIAPLGKGRCVVSQLRLIEHLDKDPVADKILLNMIRWAGKAD